MATRRHDVPTLLLLLAMYALLGGNVALHALSPLHPVVHVAIGAAAIHLAFTIWHEAVHGTASRQRRVNDAIGVLGMLPYMTPYFMQRWVHLEHHHKLNQADDPNHVYTDGPLLTLPLRYPRALGYARKLLSSDPRTRGERLSDLGTTALVGAAYVAALVTGHLADILFLWFLPVVVAKLVMDWYINYLPHRGLPPDRFLGTRIIDIGWFTPLVLSHNYHAVHHLWPTVPWHRYRHVYRKKLEYLRSHGVPVSQSLLPGRPEPARLEREGASAR
jgi:fatty acid desaturase